MVNAASDADLPPESAEAVLLRWDDSALRAAVGVYTGSSALMSMSSRGSGRSAAAAPLRRTDGPERAPGALLPALLRRSDCGVTESACAESGVHLRRSHCTIPAADSPIRV